MTRCAVIGVAGYSGAELLGLLLGHPCAEVCGVFASDKGAAQGQPTLAEVLPGFRAVPGTESLRVLAATPDAVEACGARAVFLATPHAASHELAPALLDRGITVFDLSAAFRFREPGVYPAHYGFTHARPDLLERSVYGLPELFRDRLSRADLIAVPGCYPTSAILAIRPLAGASALDLSRRVIVNSISGVSGAGRSAQVATLFCEVSVRPYEVLTHRHTPEIEAYSGVPVYFTPHVGPYDRGIVSTIHAELRPGWDASRLRAAYERAYAGEAFVRLLPPGCWPSVASVRGTNFCDIGLGVDEPGRHAVIVSAIDNLVKGAAGQAVQCFNLRHGLDEASGLLAGRKAVRA